MNSITRKNTKTFADEYDFVAGVDTHAQKHVLVILDNKYNKVGDTMEIVVVKTAMDKAIKKIVHQTGGNILFAVEGTSSYGATYTEIAMKHKARVIEVKPPKNKTRNNGKTDEIDAMQAAKTALSTPVTDAINPRVGDKQKMLRMLVAKRRLMEKQRTKTKNALVAHLRCYDLGFDASITPGVKKIKEIARWKNIDTGSDYKNLGRKLASSMAKEVLELKVQLEENYKDMEKIVKHVCPKLLDFYGVGVVSSAQILISYGYRGRIKSHEAFCKIAGAAPISASSGKFERHRLDRKGDRRLNSVIYYVILTRIRVR